MGANEELPSWLIWLQAIGSTMAGIFLVLFPIAIGMLASRQCKAMQRDRLRGSLFPVRYQIYEELVRVVLDIANALRQQNPTLPSS